MKRTYIAPLLTATAGVMRDTQGTGMLAPREAGAAYKPMASAPIGFYL